MNSRIVAIALALVVGVVADAAARNTEHNLAVSSAKDTGLAKEKLLDVPFYLKGQKHSGVAENFGTWTANRRTRAVLRSDEEACQVAFLSAVIALQKRAQQQGGNAVVDIVSITQNKETTSASEFRCNAGSTMANVALRGRVVKLK